MKVSCPNNLPKKNLLGGVLILLMSISFVARSEGLDINAKDGLSYKSSGGNFEIKLGGRLHYDGSQAFLAKGENIEDGWAVRRKYAKLGVSLYKVWRLGLQYDLASETKPYESLWLRYSGFSAFKITVGQMSGEPFSLEESTSSNVMPFMERALPNALTPSNNVGVLLNTSGSGWSAAGGVFWETYIEDSDLFNGDEGRGVTGRFTFLPVDTGDDFLHMGLSASWRWPDDSNRVRFRARPENYVGNKRLISTGRIKNIENYLLTGVESAYVQGPLTVQGEYIRSDLFFIDNEKSNESLAGGYLYAGLFITGEQRSYSRSRGVFGKVKPKGARGAWELAWRYSYLDLNGDAILGGKEENLSWGLNWYANSQVRLMLNYIEVDVDEHAGDVDPIFIQMRLQVAI